ncbi:MAG: flagellar biosynthesis switch protein [Pseudobdellovibrio sp.]|jgi:flagellar biosynthesis protein FlhG|nr:flagellar biosynthesis switch protein [Pseudobdellovibrio sp.]
MRILSVTSGKGGVGKTSIVSNMAVSLAKQGKRVLVFDGDLGMANVDIFFGVHPQKNLQDVMEGAPLRECLTPVAQNLDLLAGGSGLYGLCHLNAFQRREILAHIAEMNYSYDYLLIDTSPGLHDHVLHLNSVADECMVIITPDPSSFTDAYALIKVLHQKYRAQKFSIICNQVSDEKAGAQLYLRFADVAQQFLPIRLNYKKTVPFDPQMKLSNQLQRLIVRQDAKSVSAQAITGLCSEIVSQNQMVASPFEVVKSLDILFRPASGHA